MQLICALGFACLQFVVLVAEEGMGGPTMSLEERSDFAAATCDAENVTSCFPPNGKPTSQPPV